jgi:hypothetical protein
MLALQSLETFSLDKVNPLFLSKKWERKRNQVRLKSTFKSISRSFKEFPQSGWLKTQKGGA